MNAKPSYTRDQALEILKSYAKLYRSALNTSAANDMKMVRKAFDLALTIQGRNATQPDKPAILRTLNVTLLVIEEMGMGKTSIISTMLFDVVRRNNIPLDAIELEYGKEVRDIIEGLNRATELYKRGTPVESDNFRKLLITFAQDIRVILILIATRVELMRFLDNFSPENQKKISRETSYLYAPLAHKLGLYRIKSELEDLSLKFSNRETYKEIAHKLNDTKRVRDAYIEKFIAPLKVKIGAEQASFEIKGRTKTINSIYNKIKKQHVPFENIYDLFAIRIIIDTDYINEKADCWKIYSIVTDLYPPNPKRLRDWLSIAKSNGYESLHTTVMGPEGKWVEVQIRTKRMDMIAEKGLAAHWRYKGGKEEKGLDDWLTNVREVLENPESDTADFIDDFKLGLYEKEVFVFTPKGELRKLPQGATVLDFAFDIHSNVGCKCVGAKVNGKNVTLRHKLNSGDQVEITTASNQIPKKEWLKVVTTSKAKTKIKQVLREAQVKDSEFGRELLQRRFKNWKIAVDDGRLQKLVKQFKYGTVSEFYSAIAKEELDINLVKDGYLDLEKKETTPMVESNDIRGAENYKITPDDSQSSDILTIDENLKNIEFSLAKCCNPIFGDEIFGFVSTVGGIKIHRNSCPNAPQMLSRFGYRMVKAQWSGKSGSQFESTIRVTGNDDIGIVSNISELLTKELKIKMRSINITSADGIFYGNIAVFVDNTDKLNLIIRKIGGIKGVHEVRRIDK